MSDMTTEPDESGTDTRAILTTKQERRVLALGIAKEQLALPSAPFSGGKAAVEASTYVPSLIELSEYILHGIRRAEVEVARPAGFGFAIPAGFLSGLFEDEDGISVEGEVVTDGPADEPTTTPEGKPESEGRGF